VWPGGRFLGIAGQIVWPGGRFLGIAGQFVVVSFYSIVVCFAVPEMQCLYREEWGM